jgi:hypothetical protein
MAVGIMAFASTSGYNRRLALSVSRFKREFFRCLSLLSKWIGSSMALDDLTDWCFCTLPEINTSKLRRYEFEVAQESAQAVMTVEIFRVLRR